MIFLMVSQDTVQYDTPSKDLYIDYFPRVFLLSDWFVEWNQIVLLL